jgi:hypothetical protein
MRQVRQQRQRQALPPLQPSQRAVALGPASTHHAPHGAPPLEEAELEEERPGLYGEEFSQQVANRAQDVADQAHRVIAGKKAAHALSGGAPRGRGGAETTGTSRTARLNGGAYAGARLREGGSASLLLPPAQSPAAAARRRGGGTEARLPHAAARTPAPAALSPLGRASAGGSPPLRRPGATLAASGLGIARRGAPAAPQRQPQALSPHFLDEY